MTEPRTPLWTEHTTTAWDGTRLYYRMSAPDRADAPWLVLCDGIACDGFVWKRLIPAFAGRCGLLHWHYRGHGKSAPPADYKNLTIPDLARDLGGILAESGIPPGVLIGHSMGVQTILETWRSYPKRVAALVPLCGSYQYPLDTFHESTLLKKALPWLRFGAKRAPGFFNGFLRTTPAKASFAFAFLTGEVNRDLTSRDDMLPYFEHLRFLDFDLFTTMLHYAGLHSADDLLERIDVPTLIVMATRDAFTPAWLSEEMHRRILGSEMLVLKDGSHGAPIEYPDVINLRLEKFLLERGLLHA